MGLNSAWPKDSPMVSTTLTASLQDSDFLLTKLIEISFQTCTNDSDGFRRAIRDYFTFLPRMSFNHDIFSRDCSFFDPSRVSIGSSIHRPIRRISGGSKLNNKIQREKIGYHSKVQQQFTVKWRVWRRSDRLERLKLVFLLSSSLWQNTNRRT